MSNYLELSFYISLFVIVIGIDFFIAAKIYQREKDIKNHLFQTVILTAVVAITYILSTLFKNYFLMSFMVSLYFCSVDLLVFKLLYYVSEFTNYSNNRIVKIIKTFVCSFLLLDCSILMINPFKEIAMSFEPSHSTLLTWNYVQPYFFWYRIHLLFSYILVACSLIIFFIKMLKSPAVFRARYILPIVGIVAVIAMNAVFLYVAQESIFDFSILFYTIVCFVFYWNEFNYSEAGMLNKTRQMILDKMLYPVFLFDYEDKLAMCNNKAKEMFSENISGNSYLVDEFISDINIKDLIADPKKSYLLQCYPVRQGASFSYRCDYEPLTDHKGRIIAKLFVLMDNDFDTDILTGFATKNVFERQFSNNTNTLKYPVSIAVCDINKLSVINQILGHDVGDKAIQFLAESMKVYCPKDSYFARLEDANLMVICPETDNVQMRSVFSQIAEDLAESDIIDFPLKLQSAVAVVEQNNNDIIAAAKNALGTLKLKKLLDVDSAHTSLLDSFAQTLQEADSETEEHVKRTNLLGQKLGIKMNLSDKELAELSLLCLLHDIGKLGIPFEVLNKPGRLTDKEFELMKTHVNKGYRIALASSELSGIAELILHHHESWNGTGYPDGLKGEEIPVLSRIIAIVDTFDAMTNDRVYRKAMSVETAKEELIRCSGTQFDPDIVNVFISMLEEDEYIPKVISEKSENRKIHEISEDVYFASSTILPIMISKYYLDEEERIFEIDDSFVALTGYSREDINKLNLSQTDLIPFEDRTEYFNYVNTLKSQNKDIYLKHRILCKDGSYKTVNCYGRHYFDPVRNKMISEIVVTQISR